MTLNNLVNHSSINLLVCYLLSDAHWWCSISLCVLRKQTGLPQFNGSHFGRWSADIIEISRGGQKINCDSSQKLEKIYRAELISFFYSIALCPFKKKKKNFSLSIRKLALCIYFFIHFLFNLTVPFVLWCSTVVHPTAYQANRLIDPSYYSLYIL